MRRLPSAWGADRVGPMAIGEFYRRHIGLSHAPQSLEHWLRMPENLAAACTNGKVFCDPLGRFQKIRNDLLAFLPEDVRRLKVAVKCVSCAQTGQYNYERAARRGEAFAAQYAETKFCADLISLIYLLNKRYAPFYKWLHRGARGLPLLGREVYQRVADLLEAKSVQVKAELMEEMCAQVAAEMRRQGLSDATSPFLLDHLPSLQDGVVDEHFRQKYRLAPRLMARP